MQITLGSPTTIPVTIDGVDYHLPKFLGEAFEEREAAEEKLIWERALSQYDSKDREGRAWFSLRFQMPPLDSAFTAAKLKTAKGSREVVEWSTKKAGVPDAVRAQLFREMPQPFVRSLAGRLLGTEMLEAELKKDSGEPEDPKEGASPLTSGGGQSEAAPPTSADAHMITPSTEASSPTPTPASTPAV